MADVKPRLDQYMFQQKLAPSRTKAQDMIKAGEVLVNGEAVTDPSARVEPGSTVLLQNGETLKFVSRAGLKLEGAIAHTKMRVRNAVCLDVGQSTGGFTDVLLKFGAREVWGVEVGHSQLHEDLRSHKSVKFFENLDIRNARLHSELREKQFDLVVADLSFISLEKVIPQIYDFLSTPGEALLLVKPQFELDKKALNKQGIVKDSSAISSIEQKLRRELEANHFTVRDFFAAGVKGKDGNQEYFFYVQKN